MLWQRHQKGEEEFHAVHFCPLVGASRNSHQSFSSCTLHTCQQSSISTHYSNPGSPDNQTVIDSEHSMLFSPSVRTYLDLYQILNNWLCTGNTSSHTSFSKELSFTSTCINTPLSKWESKEVQGFHFRLKAMSQSQRPWLQSPGRWAAGSFWKTGLGWEIFVWFVERISTKLVTGRKMIINITSTNARMLLHGPITCL